MKKNRIVIILSIVLVVLIAVFGIIHFIGNNNRNDNKTEHPQITVKIIDKDKNEKVITFETEKENLNDALYEKGLISKSEHNDGYYQTINGITTDYNTDQSFWWLTVNGEDSMVGAKDIIIKDGDVFEFIYKIG